MRRAAIIGAVCLLLLPLGVALAGSAIGSSFLHPMRLPLTADRVANIDQMLSRTGAKREDFDVGAPDGILLRGWKVRPQNPNGDWVLLFHGVSDNRSGMLGHAEFLLRHGYSLVMMDARAHGQSEGGLATFGWLERRDTAAIVQALYEKENVHCLFALGESMGASIALQSAAVEPRLAGVVAESAFRNLREAGYDYAGLRISPLLGKTLFRPAVIVALNAAEKVGGFKADDISPEKAVAERAFPVLLICGLRDRNIPKRHSEAIFGAATGPKELWLVPGADHTASLGAAPAEFERRVTTFFERIHAGRQAGSENPHTARTQ